MNKYQLEPVQAVFQDGVTIAAGWAVIYEVYPETGEFKSVAYEHFPLGVGIPAHAYLDVPENVTDEFAIVRSGDKWKYLSDYRGKTIYNIHDKTSSIVNFIGDIESDYTFLEPTREFDKWVGSEWIEDVNAKNTYINMKNKEKIVRLLEAANNEITTISRAVKYNLATDEQKERLELLEIYTVKLSMVDTAVENMTLPEKPY